MEYRKYKPHRLLAASLVVGIASVTLGIIVPTSAWAEAACGAVVKSGADWAEGHGVNIVSNGNDHSGPSCDGAMNQATRPDGSVVDTGWKWQCVELVNRFYVVHGWTSSRWSGDGGEMYDTAPSHLRKEANGSIRNVGVGDVYVIQKPGLLGHVGVVSSVIDNGNGTKRVIIGSQNTSAALYDSIWNVSARTLTSIFAGFSVKGLVHAPTTPSTPGSRNDVAWQQGSTVYTFAGPGLPTIGQVGGIGAAAWNGVGDYNKDGRDDIYQYFAGTDQSIYVLQSNGNTFSSIGRVRGPGIGQPSWAATGDFDGA